uniref:ELMO domain-containing protein 1 isoform X2 n=1 Tax=Geotrypetes seraphini TaxID=260995 RepID=A0A6P8R3V4_GEOSA|nr:ELMO domain-containing protein 1 isoform X2 [Geotrypetes seraphini]
MMKHFMRMLFQVWLYSYCICLWRCLKFMVRKLTGRCELQRICYNNKPGANRTMKIETSLKNSKNKLLQTAVSVHPDTIEKIIDDILILKKISLDINPQLGVSLQACLLQIVGYRNLIVEIEKLRRESFDSDNPEHEAMLLKLWCFLKPGIPLKDRISKQWTEIGFQGDDPKTDFRGMGLLGLSSLVYFAEWDTASALQILSDSHHSKFREIGKKELSNFNKAEWEKKKFDKAIGYSFAIVGINITDLAYNLLISGALKTHMYNVAPEAPVLKHFQQTFCYLIHEFHKFWIEEDPMDIMEFNRVRNKFHKKILKQLQNPDMALCPHFAASKNPNTTLVLNPSLEHSVISHRVCEHTSSFPLNRI